MGGCSYTGSGGGAIMTVSAICAIAGVGDRSVPKAMDVAISNAATSVLII
jgi:hypothetical protein